MKAALRRVPAAWRGTAALWCVLACCPLAAAQDFPQNPIKIIVPFAAGGSIDVIARTLQPLLQADLGKPIVVEDRPGASTQLGTINVAHAAPDGYTILFTSNSHVINQVFSRHPLYDAVRDFAPISLLVRFPGVFFAHPSLKIATLNEAVALIKAAPGEYNYGSMGPGTTGYLAMELFKRRAGLDLGYVPYQGASPVMRALVSDEVQFTSLNFAIAHAALDGHRVVPLAVAGPHRLAQLPDVATVTEQGFPDLNVDNWFAAFAPAGAPPAVVQRLSTAIAAAVTDPKVHAAFADQGWEIVASSPAELDRWVREERDRWRTFVEQSGVELP